MSLNFDILFVKNLIYTCTKNGMQIDFYTSQVQLKTLVIIAELRYSMYTKSFQLQEKWSILADRL